MRRIYYLLILLPLTGFGTLFADAAECLNIGVASGAVSSAAIGRITEALFARAGSCAAIISLPQSRLNQIETQDTLDGEALRVSSYLAERPQLLAVPTAITHFSGNLYWPPGHAEPAAPSAVIGGIAGQIWQNRRPSSVSCNFAKWPATRTCCARPHRASCRDF
jgi:hypothetical protein